MVIFVNEKNEIKDVGTTTNTSLTGKVISDDTNPFKDWSDAKICCYRAEVHDGMVTMMTPYVDSRLLEHIDALGMGVLDAETSITDLDLSITETEQSLTDLDLTVADLSDDTVENGQMLTDIDLRLIELEGKSNE